MKNGLLKVTAVDLLLQLVPNTVIGVLWNRFDRQPLAKAVLELGGCAWLAVLGRYAAFRIWLWYDDALEPGIGYRNAIQAAIDSAKVVLVLWTSAACASAWVRDEAETGRRRGILFSVVCGGAIVPRDFRRSVFARIRNPVDGPTPSEISDLVGGLTNMLTAVRAADHFSIRKFLSRGADFFSTGLIYSVVLALIIRTLPRTSQPTTDLGNPSTIWIFAPLFGLAIAGIGYPASRLADWLAIRFLAINVGPSIGRLLYRWLGEAMGCALLLMITFAWQRVSFFQHSAAENILIFFAGLFLALLMLWIIFGTKYVVFLLGRQCRYFLLT